MTKGGKGPSICGNQNDVGRVRKIKRKQIYQMCLVYRLTRWRLNSRWTQNKHLELVSQLGRWNGVGDGSDGRTEGLDGNLCRRKY